MSSVKKTWVFGYSSLILPGPYYSDSADCSKLSIPCRLRGWKRNWAATRVANRGDRKRFVYLETFDVVSRYAFASLEVAPHSSLNGIATLADDAELSALDFREQGYRRVDVSAACEPYSGYSLAGPVITYIDVTGDGLPAQVNAEYINMGILGAQRWDDIEPGFLAEYCSSCFLPYGTIELMRFIYIGRDGRSIYMLHERTAEVTCLMVLPISILPDSRIQTEATIDWHRSCPKGFQSFDYRYHFDDLDADRQAVAVAGESILNALVAAIWGDDTGSYLNHSSWLVRLGCLCGHSIKTEWAHALKNDSDTWVANAANAIIREASCSCSG